MLDYISLLLNVKCVYIFVYMTKYQVGRFCTMPLWAHVRYMIFTNIFHLEYFVGFSLV